ncbi:hypothetical protein [Nocardioides sp. SR21]|uniref:hypothetical protein n=1 Tax=Nocardioides sp. SR21 TaxID=2919501 RepID=UPI001FAAC6CE|nr:hypothetical protein [Nocardioides sp. SR21]
MVPLHLGALHPVEQAVTVVLAIGPFLVLGGVIWWRRRQEDAEAEAEAQRDK